MPGKRVYLVFTFKLAVSSILIFLVFWKVPVGDVWAALTGAVWYWVLLGYMTSFPQRFLESYQTACFARVQKLDISPNQVFQVDLITCFYSLFLPGVLATGPIRWYRLFRLDHRPVNIMACVIYHRLFELFLVLLGGLIFWSLDPHARQIWIAPLVFLGLLICGISGYVLSVTRLLPQIMAAIKRWFRLPVKVVNQIDEIDHSVRYFRTMPASLHLKLVAIGTTRHLLGVSGMVILAWSLGSTVSFSGMGWMRSMLNLLEFLPITFLGLGVRDGSLALMMESAGQDATHAVALSFLMLGRMFMMGFTGGLLELIGGRGLQSRSKSPGDPASPPR